MITSFCADYRKRSVITHNTLVDPALVVASIEEVADSYGISRPFIGVILLPIVANAAEHVTSIWMARKNKMALTIGICVGSSIVRLAALTVPIRTAQLIAYSFIANLGFRSASSRDNRLDVSGEAQTT